MKMSQIQIKTLPQYGLETLQAIYSWFLTYGSSADILNPQNWIEKGQNCIGQAIEFRWHQLHWEVDHLNPSIKENHISALFMLILNCKFYISLL